MTTYNIFLDKDIGEGNVVRYQIAIAPASTHASAMGTRNFDDWNSFANTLQQHLRYADAAIARLQANVQPDWHIAETHALTDDSARALGWI